MIDNGHAEEIPVPADDAEATDFGGNRMARRGIRGGRLNPNMGIFGSGLLGQSGYESVENQPVAGTYRTATVSPGTQR